MSRSGARILVDTLRAHGADLAFGVPGESYLAVLDALHDTPALRYVVCRQEGGAATMAEAHGKLTGRPGICLVTRGPGATNASIGVHTARQDSTPLILLVGDVARGHREREAFQEVHLPAMFAPLAKWAAVVDSAERMPELVARAWSTAVSGRPGPVVLALPEDVLVEQAEVEDRVAAPVAAAPAPAALAEAERLLRAARRPLVLVGGGGWSEAACADLRRFAGAWGLPVAAAFRRQDLVDNRLPLYAGEVGLGANPRLAARLREADLLLVVGDRLGDVVTNGYELPPPARLLHVLPDFDDPNRVYVPDVALVASPPEAAAALAALEPPAEPRWRDWTRAARADYEAWLEPEGSPAGAVDLAAVVVHLRETLPDDAILANGAGNFSVWLHRFFPYRRYGTQLAPASGAMGYGVPAALAAKAVHPGRVVVCLTGDGDFLMTGQELATAVQHELAVVILVADNGMYGTIRMHQERAYPRRVEGTDLRNPDFAAYARSFGAHGELVERTEDFAAALDRALAAGRPALLHLRVDPERITPRTTISALRGA